MDIESTLFITLLIQSECMSNGNQSVIISMDEKHTLIPDIVYIVFWIYSIDIYFCFPNEPTLYLLK